MTNTTNNSPHGVTDISRYSIENQIDLIKSIKTVLKQPSTLPMVSYLYPDSEYFSFKQNCNDDNSGIINNMEFDGIIIYGKNWTYRYDSINSTNNTNVEIIIGRNCDNINQETISLHQLNFQINKLPIDIDLGPNKTVSRKHIIIQKLKNPTNDLISNCWYITVLGRNSCKINLKRVPNSKLNVPIGPLKSGTTIEVGGSQMILYFENDPFPILSLPIYSYLIPRLTTMYGLNGNDNPLLKDIISTSIYVKDKNLRIENGQNEQQNKQTGNSKDGKESIELDNTIDNVPPKKQLNNSISDTSTSPINTNKDDVKVDKDHDSLSGNTNNTNLAAVQFYTTTKPIVTTTVGAIAMKKTNQIKNVTTTNNEQQNETLQATPKKPLKRPYSNEYENGSSKNFNMRKQSIDTFATTSASTNITTNLSPSPTDPPPSNKDLKIKRPSWPYTALITRAILSSPEGCLPLSKIYEFISNLHPFYNLSITSWQNSVRHNLSINSTFVKTVNSENVSSWKLNDDLIQDFLENWYQGNLIKLKKNGGVIVKELCMFMARDDFRFPGQREPEYYQNCYMKRFEAGKLRKKKI